MHRLKFSSLLFACKSFETVMYYVWEKTSRAFKQMKDFGCKLHLFSCEHSLNKVIIIHLSTRWTRTNYTVNHERITNCTNELTTFIKKLRSIKIDLVFFRKYRRTVCSDFIILRIFLRFFYLFLYQDPFYVIWIYLIDCHKISVPKE